MTVLRQEYVVTARTLICEAEKNNQADDRNKKKKGRKEFYTNFIQARKFIQTYL